MSLFYTTSDFTRQHKVESEFPIEDYRSEFRKDYARLIHSPSFRRLNGKTQLFPGIESDFFRNRLTHSLEVAQIGKSIALRINWLLANQLNKADYELDTDLIEFCCLAHDLGHPPFGHQGEEALDEIMYNYGGFEGNAQTLRILVRLEKKERATNNQIGFDENAEDKRFGLNLTFRSIASVLKYDTVIPVSKEERDDFRESRGENKRDKARPVKGYYQEEAELVKNIKALISNTSNVVFKSIECQIMDIADDIAYSTYDLEDSLKGGFITLLDLLHADRRIRNKIAGKISEDLICRASNDLIVETISDIESNEDYKEFPQDQIAYLIKSLKDRDITNLKHINSDDLKIKYKSRIADYIITEVFSNLMPKIAVKDEDLSYLVKEVGGEKRINEDLLEYINNIIYETNKGIRECAYDRIKFTSRLIGGFVRSVRINCDNELPVLWKVYIDNEGTDGSFKDAELKIEVLKRFTYLYQIDSAKLKIVEHRGREIVHQIFNAIVNSDGDFLPKDIRQIYSLIKDKFFDPLNSIESQSNRKYQLLRYRLICDFVSSMTDDYATEFFGRLNSMNPQTIFKSID